MYCVDDEAAAQHLSLARNSLKKGGVFSLLTKGYAGAQQSVISRADFESSKTLQSDRLFINRLNELAKAYMPAELETQLLQAGFDVLSWSGVRIATDCDNRKVDSLDHDELERVLELETQLGRTESTKGGAQMLHFLCTPKVA